MCGKGQTPSISATWTVLLVACMFYGMDEIFHWVLAVMIFCGISFAVLCVTRRINPIRFMIEEQRDENFRRRLISELKKIARAQKR